MTDKRYPTRMHEVLGGEVMEWISVEDRLPDKCGYKCLVAAVNDFCQAKVFTAYTGYMERGKLEFHSCETQFDLAVWHITHWMPLPKLPEVEG